MAWKQWAIIKVQNDAKTENILIKFSDKKGIWGWMFTPVDGDDNNRVELSIGTIESHAIVPGAHYSYGHTGKADRAEGIDATIELYAVAPTAGSAAVRIVIVNYTSPWAPAGKNKITKGDVTTGWNVEVQSHFEASSGTLEHFSLVVTKKTG